MLWFLRLLIGFQRLLDKRLLFLAEGEAAGRACGRHVTQVVVHIFQALRDALVSMRELGDEGLPACAPRPMLSAQTARLYRNVSAYPGLASFLKAV